MDFISNESPGIFFTIKIIISNRNHQVFSVHEVGDFYNCQIRSRCSGRNVRKKSLSTSWDERKNRFCNYGVYVALIYVF